MGSNLCVNKKVQKLCKNYGVRCMLGMPYHSQGRGQVERANKSARSTILALAGTLGKSQADVINLAQFISNSVIRTYVVDSPTGPEKIRKSAYEMVYGHLPNLKDNELLAAYPDRAGMQEGIRHIRKLVGQLNQQENRIQEEKEKEIKGTLKEGDLVLARVMPKNVAKLGNKYRRNIYKIIKRRGRMLKIVAQFGNLEVVTIHVKNVKKFVFGKDL